MSTCDHIIIVKLHGYLLKSKVHVIIIVYFITGFLMNNSCINNIIHYFFTIISIY